MATAAAAAAVTATATAAAAAAADGVGGGSVAAPATADGEAPPPPASDMDDPADAWAEWGETAESRRSGVRRRQRPIEAGMNVDALLGMAGKTTKLFFITLQPGVAATADEAVALGGRYRNMLAAGGVTATFFSDGKGGLICQAGSFRDAVNAKDFLIRQAEVALVGRVCRGGEGAGGRGGGQGGAVKVVVGRAGERVVVDAASQTGTEGRRGRVGARVVQMAAWRRHPRAW